MVDELRGKGGSSSTRAGSNSSKEVKQRSALKEVHSMKRRKERQVEDSAAVHRGAHNLVDPTTRPEKSRQN